MQKKIKYLKSLPSKTVAVGVLLFDRNNQLLVLKPGYKDCWTIPGGIVEKLESPNIAAIREAKEEVGLAIKLVQCIGVDYLSYQLADYKGESLHIIFIGNRLSSKDVNNIHIDGKEIIEYKFVDFKDAVKMIDPLLSRRLRGLHKKLNKFVFMENGIRKA